MPDRADARVLVVGGGIAGFAMARACAQRGIPVRVVDRAAGPPDARLGLNLPGNAIRALRDIGVSDGLPAVAEPVRRREYRTPDDRLIFEVDEAAFWGRPTVLDACAAVICWPFSARTWTPPSLTGASA